MNFSYRKCADDGCLGTMVSLLIGLHYASLHLPLDNRENKNSRNVCLSQIRENIFPRKFLLIQYIASFAVYLVNVIKIYGKHYDPLKLTVIGLKLTTLLSFYNHNTYLSGSC